MVYADELKSVIVDYMQANQMFDEMVIYLDSDESGAMFSFMEPLKSIYAMTSTDTHDSSWATFCYDDATVNGTKLGTCLSNQFSYNWMKDTETSDINQESLYSQYLAVKAKSVNPKQTVSVYGDKDMYDIPIGMFQGNSSDA